MITLPRRSVTRFFIPMIDVLTLLFCVFLLMPIIRENESLSQEGAGGPATLEELKQEIEKRQKDLSELTKDQQRARSALADLETKRREFLQQRLWTRVLDITPKDGTLSFFDPRQPAAPPTQIDNEAAARKFIERCQREAGGLDVFLVFQRPQDTAVKFPLFPTDRQTEMYRAWFQGVAYGGYLTQPLPAKGNAP
jgi:hypothetical protein